MMVSWAQAGSPKAAMAAFLASLVEAVEALTIVLAVATVRGWRPAGLGALAGLLSLALIVVALGPLLDRVPLHLLQLAIGVLLLLFGMRWLRKAILRAAGVIPLHDEAKAFAAETAGAVEFARRHGGPASTGSHGLRELQGGASRSGFEVVFIVVEVSAGRGRCFPRVPAPLRPACGRGYGSGRASSAGAGSRKHAQICRRRDAVGIRHLLDRRRSRRCLAGRRFRDRCICRAVLGGLDRRPPFGCAPPCAQRFCHEYCCELSFVSWRGCSSTTARSPWRLWRSSSLPPFPAIAMPTLRWWRSHLVVWLPRSAFYQCNRRHKRGATLKRAP